MASRELDIIVFGATGFTGRHTIPHVQKFCKANEPPLKWGIAGRSEHKLTALQEEIKKDYDIDVPIAIADVDDLDDRLLVMARKCRLIINCCGPYRFYGEPVVRACIDEGTHHIDVSGEPQYMEMMQLKYNEEAKKKGVYIISACGFDSIPTDMGVVFLQQQFNGTLNSVETYMGLDNEEGADQLPGSIINFGTWESAIYGLAYAKQLRSIRSRLFPQRLPTFHPTLKTKKYPRKTSVVDGWVVPFLGSDRSVVRRSQRYFYEHDQQRPIQVETYLVIKSFLNVILSMIYGLLFLILTKFDYGRFILLKYPEFFTAGLINRLEPNEEKIKKYGFSLLLYGEGWKQKLTETTDTYAAPVDKAIIGQVKGKDPGYGATCIALTLAGIVLLNEIDKLPDNGGVYPPGAAFAKTSLIQKLNQNGVTFEILSEKDLTKK